MPQEIPKAFAVKEIPIKRFEATQGPLSSGWTLYDSSKLYEKLSAHCGFFNQKELDKALEETGFNKAVRVRMEVLAWKERCRIEAQNLNKLLTEYRKQVKKIEERLEVLNDTLQQTRNILRIQRENPNEDCL